MIHISYDDLVNNITDCVCQTLTFLYPQDDHAESSLYSLPPVLNGEYLIYLRQQQVLQSKLVGHYTKRPTQSCHK
jgi:hypothetical protein